MQASFPCLNGMRFRFPFRFICGITIFGFALCTPTDLATFTLSASGLGEVQVNSVYSELMQLIFRDFIRGIAFIDIPMHTEVKSAFDQLAHNNIALQFVNTVRSGLSLSPRFSDLIHRIRIDIPSWCSFDFRLVLPLVEPTWPNGLLPHRGGSSKEAKEEALAQRRGLSRISIFLRTSGLPCPPSPFPPIPTLHHLRVHFLTT